MQVALLPLIGTAGRVSITVRVHVLESTLLLLDEPIDYTGVHLLSDSDSEEEESAWRVAEGAGGFPIC